MKSKLYVCLFSAWGCIVVILLLARPAVAQELSAEALRRLGNKARYEGRYAEAERYLRQSLMKFEAQGERSSTDIAMSRGDLGWLLVARGSFTEAEQLFDSALKLLRKDSVEN